MKPKNVSKTNIFLFSSFRALFCPVQWLKVNYLLLSMFFHMAERPKDSFIHLLFIDLFVDFILFFSFAFCLEPGTVGSLGLFITNVKLKNGFNSALRDNNNNNKSLAQLENEWAGWDGRTQINCLKRHKCARNFKFSTYKFQQTIDPLNSMFAFAALML